MKTKCNSCSKSGHLAKMCRTKTERGDYNNGNKLQRIHQTADELQDPAQYFTMYRLEQDGDPATATSPPLPSPARERPRPTGSKYGILAHDSETDLSCEEESNYSDCSDLSVSKINSISNVNKSAKPANINKSLESANICYIEVAF